MQKGKLSNRLMFPHYILKELFFFRRYQTIFLKMELQLVEKQDKLAASIP